MKKKIEANTDTVKNEAKVIFQNDYIGLLGAFYKNNIYTIPVEIYEILKIDCKEIE